MKVSSVIVIRKAHKVDAQKIWDIRNAAISSQCIGHYSPAELRIWTDGEMTEQFIEVVEDSFYVATLDGHVVGTGMINLESGQVDAIFVHPSHMRCGIGRQVLLYLEKLALVAGLNQLSLDSTLNAARFYQARGFVGDSVTKYESPRGISLDCIQMIKKIRTIEKNACIRLNSARQATAEGRYEEALSEFVWFHDHALEEEPALYGVRLSFALMYWMELAEAYPKAKLALEEIRDRKTDVLIHGEGNRETFHDVEAINEALGCTAHTYSLFVQLASSNSALAESCSKLALPAIVCEGDFALAARYLPEPENRIIELGKSLNEDIEDLKQFPHPHAPLRDAHIQIYASQVQLIVSIVAGVGHSQDANRLRSLASKIVKTASVRKAIRSVLATEA